MTAKQFRQWEIYDSIEPVGGTRLDVVAAQITAMIYNMAVDVKNRKPIRDFLLTWKGEDVAESGETVTTPPKTEQSVEEKMWYAMNISAMQNALAMSDVKVIDVEKA